MQDVEIGVADPGGGDTNDDISRPGSGICNVLDFWIPISSED